jgi:fluoride ion exporter CrcB/FEX
MIHAIKLKNMPIGKVVVNIVGCLGILALARIIHEPAPPEWLRR